MIGFKFGRIILKNKFESGSVNIRKIMIFITGGDPSGRKRGTSYKLLLKNSSRPQNNSVLTHLLSLSYKMTHYVKNPL